MTAGMNRLVNIWRNTYQSDDVVGGAVITGSYIYYNVHARLQSNTEQQLLLQQGLEVPMTFSGVVVPGTLDIRERDELEVVAPRDDPYYETRFRVVGSKYSSLNPRDPRAYIMLTLSRSERAHGRQ